MSEPLAAAISAAVAEQRPADAIADVAHAPIHVVALAFRRALFPLLVERDENCYRLLQLCMDCYTNGYLSADANTVMMSLLEDALDLLPIEACEKVFQFMERNAHQPLFLKVHGPRLVRLINGLKRRLSRTQDIELSGRLLMFLASIFPMSDKSGVNLVSNVNIANKTSFDETAEELTSSQQAAKPEDTISLSSLGQPLNKRDYKDFWTLQRYFCDPRLCYQSEDWKTFTKATEAVLDLFDRHPVEDVQVHHQAIKVGAATNMDTSSDESHATRYDASKTDSTQSSNSTTFAKYLTSPKLFELQLNDVSLRREVLVQFLILFSYLPRESKFKVKSDVLNPLQQEWIEKHQERVEQLLRVAGSDGEAFLVSAKSMLEREAGWVQWKEDGCPEFEKQEGPKRKAQTADQHVNAVSMGSEELNRLWSICPDNLEACKRAKIHIPTLQEYFGEAISEMDPAEQVEEEYWSINDFRFNWKGLRLISRERINLFHFADKPNLKAYMQSTLDILGREFAAESNAQEEGKPSAGEGDQEAKQGGEEQSEQDGDQEDPREVTEENDASEDANVETENGQEEEASPSEDTPEGAAMEE
eukprot:m.41935 g.41935  ORF g.41935 m.41935 type:complete len:588 (+) comp11873_c0_seq1:233-1996(+)